MQTRSDRSRPDAKPIRTEPDFIQAVSDPSLLNAKPIRPDPDPMQTRSDPSRPDANPIRAEPDFTQTVSDPSRPDAKPSDSKYKSLNGQGGIPIFRVGSDLVCIGSLSDSRCHSLNGHEQFPDSLAPTNQKEKTNQNPMNSF
jgi:hypothetical protein